MILAQSKTSTPNITLTKITAIKNQVNEKRDEATRPANRSLGRSVTNQTEKEKAAKNQSVAAQRNSAGKTKTRNYLQNMPIKGNRKNLPQKAYLFADSDFDNNASIRSPAIVPFQSSFNAKSPTLSRRDGRLSSSS